MGSNSPANEDITEANELRLRNFADTYRRGYPEASKVALRNVPTGLLDALNAQLRAKADEALGMATVVMEVRRARDTHPVKSTE